MAVLRGWKRGFGALQRLCDMADGDRHPVCRPCSRAAILDGWAVLLRDAVDVIYMAVLFRVLC